MDNYKVIEKLGRGTHGTAYLLRSFDDSKLVVCKSVIEKYTNHARNEVDILSKLNHRRVINIIDNIQLGSSMLLILEHANGGNLAKMIQSLIKNQTKQNTSIAWSVLSQISDALYYIHSKKVIHRDVKPANILVNIFRAGQHDHLEFKLCDFSLSTRFEEHGVSMENGATVGTPFYMAPEIVAGRKYGPSVDVWGLGVVLYEILNLKKPFTGDCRKDLYECIMAKDIPKKEISHDEELAGLIHMCLAKTDRVSAKTIAKNDKVRFNLIMLELKYKENEIGGLKNKIKEYELIGSKNIL